MHDDDGVGLNHSDSIINTDATKQRTPHGQRCTTYKSSSKDQKARLFDVCVVLERNPEMFHDYFYNSNRPMSRLSQQVRESPRKTRSRGKKIGSSITYAGPQGVASSRRPPLLLCPPLHRQVSPNQFQMDHHIADRYRSETPQFRMGSSPPRLYSCFDFNDPFNSTAAPGRDSPCNARDTLPTTLPGALDDDTIYNGPNEQQHTAAVSESTRKLRVKILHCEEAAAPSVGRSLCKSPIASKVVKWRSSTAADEPHVNAVAAECIQNSNIKYAHWGRAPAVSDGNSKNDLQLSLQPTSNNNIPNAGSKSKQQKGANSQNDVTQKQGGDCPTADNCDEVSMAISPAAPEEQKALECANPVGVLASEIKLGQPKNDHTDDNTDPIEDDTEEKSSEDKITEQPLAGPSDIGAEMGRKNTSKKTGPVYMAQTGSSVEHKNPQTRKDQQKRETVPESTVPVGPLKSFLKSPSFDSLGIELAHLSATTEKKNYMLKLSTLDLHNSTDCDPKIQVELLNLVDHDQTVQTVDLSPKPASNLVAKRKAAMNNFLRSMSGLPNAKDAAAEAGELVIDAECADSTTVNTDAEHKEPFQPLPKSSNLQQSVGCDPALKTTVDQAINKESDCQTHSRKRLRTARKSCSRVQSDFLVEMNWNKTMKALEALQMNLGGDVYTFPPDSPSKSETKSDLTAGKASKKASKLDDPPEMSNAKHKRPGRTKKMKLVKDTPTSVTKAGGEHRNPSGVSTTACVAKRWKVTDLQASPASSEASSELGGHVSDTNKVNKIRLLAVTDDQMTMESSGATDQTNLLTSQAHHHEKSNTAADAKQAESGGLKSASEPPATEDLKITERRLPARGPVLRYFSQNRPQSSFISESGCRLLSRKPLKSDQTNSSQFTGKELIKTEELHTTKCSPTDKLNTTNVKDTSSGKQRFPHLSRIHIAANDKGGEACVKTNHTPVSDNYVLSKAEFAKSHKSDLVSGQNTAERTDKTIDLASAKSNTGERQTLDKRTSINNVNAFASQVPYCTENLTSHSSPLSVVLTKPTCQSNSKPFTATQSKCVNEHTSSEGLTYGRGSPNLEECSRLVIDISHNEDPDILSATEATAMPNCPPGCDDSVPATSGDLSSSKSNDVEIINASSVVVDKDNSKCSRHQRAAAHRPSSWPAYSQIPSSWQPAQHIDFHYSTIGKNAGKICESANQPGRLWKYTVAHTAGRTEVVGSVVRQKKTLGTEPEQHAQLLRSSVGFKGPSIPVSCQPNASAHVAPLTSQGACCNKRAEPQPTLHAARPFAPTANLRLTLPTLANDGSLLLETSPISSFDGSEDSPGTREDTVPFGETKKTTEHQNETPRTGVDSSHESLERDESQECKTSEKASPHQAPTTTVAENMLAHNSSVWKPFAPVASYPVAGLRRSYDDSAIGPMGIVDFPHVRDSRLINAGHIFEAKRMRPVSITESPPPPLLYGGMEPSMTNQAQVTTTVEVAIVGSPEVFGQVKNAQPSSDDTPPKIDPPVITIDGDERVIERCEQKQSADASGTGFATGFNRFGSITAGTSLGSSSLCLPTMASKAQPNSAPSVLQKPLSPHQEPQLRMESSARESGGHQRTPSDNDSVSTDSGTEEPLVTRRGSFSTGTHPPPKKRFVLSATPEETRISAHADSTGQKYVQERTSPKETDLHHIMNNGVSPLARTVLRSPQIIDSSYEAQMAFRGRSSLMEMGTRRATPQEDERHAAVRIPTMYTQAAVQGQRKNSTPSVPMGPIAVPNHVTNLHNMHPGPPIPQAMTRPTFSVPGADTTWSGRTPEAISAMQHMPVPIPPRHVVAPHPQQQAQAQANGVHRESPPKSQQQTSPALPMNGQQRDNKPMSYHTMQEIKQLPHGDQFQVALSSWEWVVLDNVRLPCVFRGAQREKYVAVHMVQMRLLSKFPPNVPGEIMRRNTMVSHKMAVMESWIFNTVNALHCRFEFGCQLFTTHDEVVKLFDVEKFYLAVKNFNLNRMADVYRQEIRETAQLHLVLTAHISSLKSHAEQEANEVQRTLQAVSLGGTSTTPLTSQPNHQHPSAQLQQPPNIGQSQAAAAVVAQNAALLNHYARAQAAAVHANNGQPPMAPHPVAAASSHSAPHYNQSLEANHHHHQGFLNAAAAYAAAASAQPQPPPYMTPNIGHAAPAAATPGMPSQPGLNIHAHSAYGPYHHQSATANGLISPNSLRYPYGVGVRSNSISGGKPAAAAMPHIYR